MLNIRVHQIEVWAWCPTHHGFLSKVRQPCPIWRRQGQRASAGVDTFSGLTAEQVIERLDAAQITNAQVNDMHAVWEHPQLKARNHWREVKTSVGAYFTPS